MSAGPGPLVLSIFPGIDLLGRAFEEEGYCVVRAGDPLFGQWGIERFHPPPGVFRGIIGGPPCNGESKLWHLNGQQSTMAPDFARVVREAKPEWFVMEAVKPHYDLDFGMPIYILKLSPRWLGEAQSRVRYFHSNLCLEPYISVCLFEDPKYEYAVLAGHGPFPVKSGRQMVKYSWPDMLRLQGLPADFDIPAATRQMARYMVGNAVPMIMGRAIAGAVRRAS